MTGTIWPNGHLYVNLMVNQSHLFGRSGTRTLGFLVDQESYTWCLCDLRKPVLKERKVNWADKGRRDPEAPQRCCHGCSLLFSSWIRPPGGPLPSLLLDYKTNFPFCLSQLEQIVTKCPLIKTSVKWLLVLTSLHVCTHVYTCVLREGLFNLIPKASLVIIWTWQNYFLLYN